MANPTVGITHDAVISAASSAYTLLRESYIDLHGRKVTLKSNNLGVNRLDEYGDIINQTTFTSSDINLVFDLKQYYVSVASYENSTNGTAIIPLLATCKLGVTINAGDKIEFNHTMLISPTSPVTEFKDFQVSKVETIIHVVPVAKRITLVPVRDN